MKKYLLILLFFTISINSFAQINVKKAPNWVLDIKFPKQEKTPVNELSYGIEYLLIDHQINIIKQERFTKNSIRIINNSGIQNISSISINYDPSYQKVIFHKIEIHRENKILNKLKVNNFQSYQQESNTESLIYDGSTTITTHIDDVREGDILSYSYTIKGFNPIFKGHFSNVFHMNNQVPIVKNHVRIISPKKLYTKNTNYNKSPRINTHKNNYEYTWIKENSKAIKLENNIPIWEIIYETIEITSFKNWNEMATWASEVFSIDKSINNDIEELIKNIKKNTSDTSKRTSKVLNFVQDNIRYLGLESGIGAYKPFHPNKVMKRRYGDCKDKSLLMVAILKELDIEAYPALVNSYLGSTMKNLLPSYSHFNHCIVKVIDEEGSIFWFDPTFSNQGGDFYTTYIPEYKYALVVDKSSKKLEEIITNDYSQSIIYDEFIVQTDSSSAIFNSKKVYYGSLADSHRQIFKENSLTNIQQSYKETVSNLYYDVSIFSKMTFEDNRNENTFTIYESYKIGSLWQPSSENSSKSLASFHPNSIYSLFILPTEKTRKHPFYLIHPIKAEHNIKIKLDKEWEISNDYLSISSKKFFYDYMTKYDPETYEIDISYIYQTYSDHVTTSEYEKFFSDMKKVKQNIGYSLIKSDIQLNNIAFNDNIIFYYLSIGALIWISFILIWIALKIYKHDPILKEHSYYVGNENFNIWLVSIVLFLGLSIIITFLFNFDTLSSNWLFYMIIQKDYATGFKIFFLSLIAICNIIFTTLALILCIKRRRSFPKIITIILICQLFFSSAEYFISLYTNPIIYGSDNRHLIPLLVFIKTVAIGSYLFLADAPKEIFIQSLAQKKQ